MRAAVRRRPWPDATYWCVDLELTGLDARRDEIVAVGMVPVRNARVCVGEGVQRILRADRISVPAAVAAHHLLPSEVSAGEDGAQVCADIATVTAGTVLVCHHAPLDLAFLRRAMGAAGCALDVLGVVDTMTLAARLDRRRSLYGGTRVPGNLSAARAALGLPEHAAHDPLDDAIATAELLLVLAAHLEVRTVGDLLR